MYQSDELNKIYDFNSKISVVRYSILEEMLVELFGVPIEEIDTVGLDEYVSGCGISDKSSDMNLDTIIDSIKEQGIYGFAREEGEKGPEIHVWVSERASMSDVVAFVGHERGHLIRPYRRNLMKEEIKAETYGLCAEFAYKVAKDLLLNKDK